MSLISSFAGDFYHGGPALHLALQIQLAGFHSSYAKRRREHGKRQYMRSLTVAFLTEDVETFAQEVDWEWNALVWFSLL